MTTTLSDLKRVIRDRTQNAFLLNKMSAGKTFDLLDKTIEDEINNGQNILATHSRFYKKRVPMITTERLSKYDFPDDLVEAHNIYYYANWRSYPLNFTNHANIQYWRAISEYDPSAYDADYELNKIVLFPAPKYTGEVFMIEGSYLPPALVNDTDVVLVPPMYIPALRDFVVSQIQLLVGLNDESKQSAFSVSAKLVSDFIAAVELLRRRKNFQSGKMPKTVRGDCE